MNYGKDHQELEEKVQRTKDEAVAARNWLEFLTKHPELRFGGYSNQNIFIGYFGSDYPGNFTVPALEESYNNPEVRKQLCIDDADSTGERKKLLAELKTVFHGPQENWQNELMAIRYQTNDQVRQKIETLRSKHEMQKLDVSALKATVRAGTATLEREPLPDTYTRRMLVKELSPLDLRRIIQRYGKDQINRRIAGISL